MGVLISWFGFTLSSVEYMKFKNVHVVLILLNRVYLFLFYEKIKSFPSADSDQHDCCSILRVYMPTPATFEFGGIYG